MADKSKLIAESKWEDEIQHLYKVQDRKVETKAFATLPQTVAVCKYKYSSFKHSAYTTHHYYQGDV